MWRLVRMQRSRRFSTQVPNLPRRGRGPGVLKGKPMRTTRIPMGHLSTQEVRPSAARCKAPSALQGPWWVPQTRSTATAPAEAPRGKQNGARTEMQAPSPCRKCCLTPRSSGAPTAGHQARSGGTRYIFASPGLASYRCRPLSSNVRPHKT